MPAKSDAWKNDLMKFVFNSIPISGMADNAASGLLTTLTLAFHTADPGAAGNQSTSEVTATGYTRQTVLRTTAGWTVTANAAALLEAAIFGIVSAGAGGTITHFSVGTGVSNKMLYRGPVVPPQPILIGVELRLAAQTVITED